MSREEVPPASAPPPGSDGPASVTGLSALLADLAGAPAIALTAAWAAAPRPGDRIGRFELREELGRGGFGVVFEAFDLELRRTVAFKAIRPALRPRAGEGEEAALRREAEAVAALHHPNIVTLHDAGRCEAGPYLILERLHGETLAARLRRGPVALPEALRIGGDVARALAHAHGRGVLHRDLKPANVFLVEGDGAKVLDFGLAHVFGAGGPSGAGTPGYMAPERRAGGAEDERSDVYALGVLLAELLGAARPAGGGPPRVPAGVPPRLAALVERATAADPAARPASAQAVADALARARQALEPRRWRRRWVAGAVAAVALLAAGAGWWAGRRGEASAAPPRVVAVADVENATGEPDLDALSGLLATALEQSRRLAVVPRARLLPRGGTGGAALLTEAAVREPARAAGATALLVPAVARQGGGYLLTLRGLAPPDGRSLFTVRAEADGRAALPDAIDRLGEAARRALHEGAEERAAGGLQVGAALTGDLEAYRWYFLGEQCAARPVLGQDCAPFFQRAVAHDPAFAAAWYRLAAWSWVWGGERVGQREAAARAAANAAGAPEKERLLIEALGASLEGRHADAMATYGRLTARWPEDPQAWALGATELRRQDEFAASVPWLERAAALEPDAAGVLGDLADSLAAAGATERLRALAAAWEAAPRPASLHALSLARGWLGDAAGAEQAARRALTLSGGLLAQEDLLAARLFAGHVDEVAAASAALSEPGSEVRPIGFYAAAAVEAYRGRPRAGLARLDALLAVRPASAGDALYRTLRVDYLLGLGDVRRVRQEVAALSGLAPSEAAEHAAALAWLGDAAGAAEVARAGRPGSRAARTWEAVAQVRRGEVEAGLAALRAVVDESPVAVWRVAPLFLYADLCAEQGRLDEAAAALRRFQGLYLPRMLWRAWALPRSRLLLAEVEARRGNRAAARAALDLLLTEWSVAERDAPLLERARALRASLAR